MDIRRLYPLLVLLAVSNPHGGCDRGDKRDGSKDDTQEGSNGSGGGGGGCSPSSDDTSTEDSKTNDTGPPVDNDEDGYFTPEDCNDMNDTIHPGVVDLCDAIDNNCDGNLDEDVVACFYGEDDVVESLEDEFTVGDETAPVDVYLDSPGRLILGSGEYFVSLRISANITIEGAGSDQTTLSGGSLRSVVVVSDNPTSHYEVSLSDLSIVDGFGSELDPESSKYSAGGGILCHSTAPSPTLLSMSNIVVADSLAEHGGVIYAYGCDVDVTDASFTGLAGDSFTRIAGAMFLVNSKVIITRVTMTGFTASRVGGAVYVGLESSLKMVDSDLTNNSAESFGGHIYSFGAVNCEGSTATAGVRLGQSGSTGGGVYLAADDAATVTSNGCDWGGASGSNDNSPDDINGEGLAAGQSFTTESFTCDAYNGCTLTK